MTFLVEDFRVGFDNKTTWEISFFHFMCKKRWFSARLFYACIVCYKDIKIHQAILHRIIRDYTKQCKILSSKRYMTELHTI